MNLLTILARAFSLWPAGDSIAVISQNRKGELFVCHPCAKLPAPFPMCQADANLETRKSGHRQTAGWTHWERLYHSYSNTHADNLPTLPLEVAGDWSAAIVTKGAWLAKRAELFPNEPMPEPDQPKQDVTRIVEITVALTTDLTNPMAIKQAIHDTQARIAKLHEQLNREKDLCSDYFRALGELGFMLAKSSVQPPM